MKSKPKKTLGRDPTWGRTLSRNGPHLSFKNKLKNRKSKLARKEKRKQLDGEE